MIGAVETRQMNAVRGSERPSQRKRRATTIRRPRPSLRKSRQGPELPHPRLAWYAGVVVVAAFDVIEWPLAIVMMLGHEIAHRTHSAALRDFAEGVEAGT